MTSRPGFRDQDLSSARLRSSPTVVAAVAGFAGVICGALIVALLAKPAAMTPAAKTERTAQVETTGVATAVAPIQTAAPAGEAETPAAPQAEEAASAVVATDCGRQAWPYITPQCQAEREASQRKVRVIRTDKLAPPVVDAIETARAKREAAKAEDASVRAAPHVMPPEPVQSRPGAVAPSSEEAVNAPPERTDPPVDQNKAASPSAAPPIATQSASTAPAAAPAPESKRQRAAIKKEERSKSAREQRKHETITRVSPPRPADDDEDDVSNAPNSYRTRTMEREGSSRRVGARWIERVYEVPSYNGSERRRVIVIRPGNDEQRIPFLPSARESSRSIFQY